MWTKYQWKSSPSQAPSSPFQSPVSTSIWQYYETQNMTFTSNQTKNSLTGNMCCSGVQAKKRLFFISASFYGSGWVSLPMQDAQSTTDLSFRFRTSRAESLLVLIAGRTDYCLVMLQAGAIKVSLTEFFQYTDKSYEESSNTCTTFNPSNTYQFCRKTS